MALQMVHMLVADCWAQRYPEYLDSPEFFLGVTGPDAIYIRDGYDKTHKNEIHLDNWSRLNRQPVIDYWRTWKRPFDVGYGVHVLTDAQWVPRFRERLPQLILPDGKVNQGIYYNDCFVTDFELLHDISRLREIMKLLERAQAPTEHPLLGFHEFDEYRKHLIRLYAGECPRHDPVQYVTADYVMEFVNESSALIDEIFEEAMDRPAL